MTAADTLDLVRTELAAELGDGVLTTDPDVVASHARDEALFCPDEGAVALVRAQTVEDVQATLRFATRHRVPVVPQGARTGLSGGANAVPGCLLLSVERMTRILDVDTAERTVTVEPGIINQDLKDALAEHDLSYPPDPGSVRISSIGGNVATNAGGLCCVKYGVTRDYVRRLKVVLADGTLTTIGTTAREALAETRRRSGRRRRRAWPASISAASSSAPKERSASSSRSPCGSCPGSPTPSPRSPPSPTCAPPQRRSPSSWLPARSPRCSSRWTGRR